MKGLVSLGVFDIPKADRVSFKSGDLWRCWLKDYPGLFDADDVRLLKEQSLRGYHYYEWRAAVLLKADFGYHSLIEKYQFKNHVGKQAIFLQRVPDGVKDLLARRKEYGNSQMPDLFAYKPDDPADWFFCEVKGGPDPVRPTQEAYFRALGIVAGKAVRLIQFRPV